MDTELITQVPIWGIFAFIMAKLVLDWAKDWRGEAKPSNPGASEPTSTEAIAAVIRDQQERAQTMDMLRRSVEGQDKLADALGRVAAAQSAVAHSQDLQTSLLQESAARDRVIIEKLEDHSRRIRIIQRHTTGDTV